MRDYPDSTLFAAAPPEGQEKILEDARMLFKGPVSILVPAYREIHPATAASIHLGVSALASRGIDVHVEIANGTLLPDVREELAARAVNASSRLTVWIDADMMFTPETLIGLVEQGISFYSAGIPGEAYDEKEPYGKLMLLMQSMMFCLGLPYPRRGGGAPELALRWLATPPLAEQLDIVKDGHLMHVRSIGLGMALVPGACLALLESPLFAREWNVRTGAYEGEDYGFCSKLLHVGGYVLADFGIPAVTHITEEQRDLSWFYLRAQAVAGDQEAKKIDRGLSFRRPKPTHPHQKGGVVEPSVEEDKTDE